MTASSAKECGKCRTIFNSLVFPAEIFMKKDFVFFYFINGRIFCCDLVYQLFTFEKFDVFSMLKVVLGFLEVIFCNNFSTFVKKKIVDFSISFFILILGNSKQQIGPLLVLKFACRTCRFFGCKFLSKVFVFNQEFLDHSTEFFFYCFNLVAMREKLMEFVQPESF